MIFFYTLVNKITGKLTWRQFGAQGLHIFSPLIGAMIVFASFCSPSLCGSAALNLGCVSMRASRSQRHTNPRSYLTLRTHEPPSAPTITTYEHRPQLSPIHSGNQLNLARATSINSTCFVLESNCHVNPNANLTALKTVAKPRF